MGLFGRRDMGLFGRLNACTHDEGRAKGERKHVSAREAGVLLC